MNPRANLIHGISQLPLVMVLVLSGFLSSNAYAQSDVQTSDKIDSRTTTVLGRDRPELDPLGVRISGFVMSPSLGLEVERNDNIFATQGNKRDDLITTINPAVRISSDWNQHYLAFSGSSDIVRYASNGAEDHETYDLSLEGRVDIRNDTHLKAKAAYGLGSEERASVDDVGGRTPTEFDVSQIEASIAHKFNRVSLSAASTFYRRDFDDVASNAGTINNDDRDRDELTATFGSGYEIQDEYEAYAEVILTSVDYDASVDDNGLNRDSDGYEVRAGARVDVTGLIFGDIFLGYLSRDYDGATLRSVDTVVGGIGLTWNVTPLTTIKGSFERGVSETTLATASGSLTTGYKLSADHELLRNLILSASAGLSFDEFEGSNREDDYLKIGVGAKYLINRNFSLGLRYEYSERDSNAAGSSFEVNRILIRLISEL